MDKNTSGNKNLQKSKQANRMLYTTVLVVLVIMAVLVGITASMSRSGKKNERVVTGNQPLVTEPPAAPITTRADISQNTAPQPPATAAVAESEEAIPTVTPPSELPKFVLPVSGSVSHTHDSTALVWSRTMEDYRVHMGIDISASIGDNVVAAAAGEVSEVYVDPFMGTCVSILHSGDSVSVYKNLGEVLASGIEVGAKVTAGQIIGSVGESAIIEIADEPHLHFEIMVNGVQVDPLTCFDAEVISVFATATNQFED